MSEWVTFNKEWLSVSAGIIFIIILSKLFHVNMPRVSSIILLEKNIKLRTVYILSFVFFILGWAIASNITYFQRPEYQLYDFRSANAFNDIVESVPLNMIDLSAKDTGFYESFYTSDEPFLIKVKDFRGIIFCPARPEKMGKAGVIPLGQLAIHRPQFKALAILSTKISILVGNKKKLD